MAEKRRLPVIQATSSPREPDGSAEGDGEERPPWHWVGFGTVGTFGAWLPLMGLAQMVSNQLVASTLGVTASPEAMRVALAAAPELRLRVGLALAVPHALALALASAAGGFLVGRYSKGLGPREAAIAGVALAIIVGGLTFGSVGAMGFATTLVLSAPFSALGGHIDKRRAPPVTP